jgi:hypothetical protein
MIISSNTYPRWQLNVGASIPHTLATPPLFAPVVK